MRMGRAPSRSGGSERPMSHCACQEAQSSSAPVEDPEDAVVSLARLLQRAADRLQCVCHLAPPRIEDGAPRGRRALASAGVTTVIMAGERKWLPERECDSSNIALSAADPGCGPSNPEELTDARYISFPAGVRHSMACIWPGEPRAWRHRGS